MKLVDGGEIEESCNARKFTGCRGDQVRISGYWTSNNSINEYVICELITPYSLMVF